MQCFAEMMDLKACASSATSLLTYLYNSRRHSPLGLGVGAVQSTPSCCEQHVEIAVLIYISAYVFMHTM